MNSSTFVLNEITNDDKKLQSIPTQNSTLKCKVSPMVVMSVLNHYQRRPSNKQTKSNNQPQHLYPKFVIGLLFGNKQTNSIIINDAFGLEIQLNPEDQVIFIKIFTFYSVYFIFSVSSNKNRKFAFYALYQIHNKQGSGSKCRQCQKSNGITCNRTSK